VGRWEIERGNGKLIPLVTNLFVYAKDQGCLKITLAGKENMGEEHPTDSHVSYPLASAFGSSSE